MSKRARNRPSPARALPRAAAVPPLYHVGVRLFATFSLAMILAFWPSYFSRLTAQPSLHHHAHGLAMTLWLGLLVAQASLMRSGKRALHRRLGLLSYLLVPVIVVVTLRFVHYTLQEGPPQLGAYGLFFLALVVMTLVTFVVLFVLAMLYRAQPAVHARFMVSTLFPLFPPVTDRLIGRFMPSIIDSMPRIGGGAILQCAGFCIADTILAGLAVWDWQRNGRRVFLVALASSSRAGRHPHRPPLRLWQAFGPWFCGAAAS
jgi:hypothetical protein